MQLSKSVVGDGIRINDGDASVATLEALQRVKENGVIGAVDARKDDNRVIDSPAFLELGRILYRCWFRGVP